jgi:hypothetical protein
LYKEALRFAQLVTTEFKTNEYNNYTTMFGTGRIKDIIGTLESSAQITFEQVMTDTTIPIEERIAIWGGVDSLEPQLRPRVYDRIADRLQSQYTKNPLSRIRSFDQAFPEPPGLDAWRRRMAAEAVKAREKSQENDPSNTVERK